MFEIKKIIKCVSWMGAVCYFSFSDGMSSSVPLESVAHGIFNGDIESVQAGITAGEDVNEELFCSELNRSIKPLVLAIKCLNKAKGSAQFGYRLDIIKLLIHEGCDIDNVVTKAVTEIKDACLQSTIKKLFKEDQQKELEKEFIELMEAIKEERQAQSEVEDEFEVIKFEKDSQLTAANKLEPTEKIEIVEPSMKKIDPVDEANKSTIEPFVMIDDYKDN